MTEDKVSRREFLAKTSLAASTVVAGEGGAGIVAALDHNDLKEIAAEIFFSSPKPKFSRFHPGILFGDGNGGV